MSDTVSLTVRIPAELRKQLKTAAAEREVTAESIVIRALQRELQPNDAERMLAEMRATGVQP